jgi:Cof subfamily protein (haloacid dehalogenase superfamily)
VEAVATDLDHTLTWRDGVLRPRTVSALGRTRDAGIPVIVVTGRMVQSLRRVLEPAGLHDPVICYQGAAVVDGDGTWLLHAPIEIELAREAIAAVEAEGYDPNVYVGDELYVSRITAGSRAYADFQQIPIHPVGDVKAWLPDPPTKIVCVGDPEALDRLGERMRERFDGRLWVTKSLAKFLEFATVGVSKGSGMEFLSQHYGFARERTLAFGDGENDVELVEWAGYGIAVENAHERVKAVADWICPPAAKEGVAQVLEALLDSRR